MTCWDNSFQHVNSIRKENEVIGMDAQSTSVPLTDVSEDRDPLLHCFVVGLLLNILLATYYLSDMQINSSKEKLSPSFM